MSRYTKRHRHRIYKQALRAFDEGKLDRGLCKLFRLHTDAVEYVYGFQLKEFNELMPPAKHLHPVNGARYSWSLTPQGNAARRRCLVKCIELTKPTQKKTK